jgi:hypothetical protein
MGIAKILLTICMLYLYYFIGGDTDNASKCVLGVSMDPQSLLILVSQIFIEPSPTHLVN